MFERIRSAEHNAGMTYSVLVFKKDDNEQLDQIVKQFVFYNTQSAESIDKAMHDLFIWNQDPSETKKRFAL
jgi:hypothetical protein